MQSILLLHMLAARSQAQQSFSTCNLTEKSQLAEHMIGSIHTGHTSGCLQQPNAQLRAMLVCYAKHSAASYACCKHSGTAQLQHMQCDSEITACRAYDRQCLKAGCLHCNTKLRAMPVYHAKHSVASYACCKESGTAELQHMQ